MRQQRMTGAYIVVLALVLVGGTANAQDQWRPPFQSGQGPTPHGTRDLAYERVSIPLTQRDGRVFTFDEGNLRAANGASLVGQSFQDGARTATFRIVARAPHHTILHAPDGGTPDLIDSTPAYEYLVTVNGVNLCEGNALAVPYAWSGNLLVAPPGPPTSFTFACVPVRDGSGVPVGGGVIAKCVDWGYGPWGRKWPFRLDPRIDTTLVSYDEEVAKRFHQTCVTMAMADYCGEGTSNTVDGTPIGVADIQTVANPDGGLATVSEGSPYAVLQGTPPPGVFTLSAAAPFDEHHDPLRLEAIWGFDRCDGDGHLPAPNTVPCDRARILCIARARWSTLSLAATCVNHETSSLILNPCTDTSTVKCHQFCEDWTLDDLRAKRPTLISYSAAWDRALVSFRSPDDRWITTSRVGRPMAAFADERNGFVMAPDPTTGGSFTEVRYEGRIFRSTLPATVWAGQKPLVPLYRCRRNGEYALSRGDSPSAPCPPEYGPDGTLEVAIEGLIYAPDHPAARDHDPLYLWKKTDTAGAHYATSTLQPEGYVMEGTGPLGYLPGTRQHPPLPLPPPPRTGCSTPGGRGALSFAPVLGALLAVASGGRSLRRRYRRTTAARLPR